MLRHAQAASSDRLGAALYRRPLALQGSQPPRPLRLSLPQLPRRSERLERLPACAWRRSTQAFGNANRLSPARPVSLPNPPPSGDGLSARVERCKGQLLYLYFSWRQDTWSDLQLFLGINLLVCLLGAGAYGAFAGLIDGSARPNASLWSDLYAVLSVVLGQELPPDSSPLLSQAWAVAISIVGLASFALVLALMEQVVLEVLEHNVKQGSAVYERGHTVVLAWGSSEQELSQLHRILDQLCEARRAGLGTDVVVVLTEQREKLEMERIFRDAIKKEKRHGVQFVFRQGSPLDPSALRMVAATDARSVIVSADYSGPALEADAQSLRTAVLLDEMCSLDCVGQSWEEGAGPVVVKTSDGLSLLRYACSSRVIPVPTTIFNVQRFARLLRLPIAATLTHMLTDYGSLAHACLQSFPQLEGQRFDSLFARFPNSLVLGLMNGSKCELNPPPATIVRRGDKLLMLRPGIYSTSAPLDKPLTAEGHALQNWDPAAYVLKSQDSSPLGVTALHDYLVPAQQPTAPADRFSGGRAPVPMARDSDAARLGQQSLYMLPVPLQYHDSAAPAGAEHLLITGWGEESKMWALLHELDHGATPLPDGSAITLVNDHSFPPRYIEEGCTRRGITRAAIVMCDSLWSGRAHDGRADGAAGLDQAEMLRMDADVLMVQLNIRCLLDAKAAPALAMVVEKTTYIGLTRFEDATRLPLGVSTNLSSYSAKALAHAALEPHLVEAAWALGRDADVFVQDSSAFAAQGEELSFLALQARAASVRQVLLGYYRLPTTAASSLEASINPQGAEERTRRQVFNVGDFRCKLVTLAEPAVANRTRTGSTGSQDEEAASVASSVVSAAGLTHSTAQPAQAPPCASGAGALS
eukprot:scaffold2.g7502.t1